MLNQQFCAVNFSNVKIVQSLWHPEVNDSGVCEIRYLCSPAYYRRRVLFLGVSSCHAWICGSVCPSVCGPFVMQNGPNYF